jgi:hypothetical protein
MRLFILGANGRTGEVAELKARGVRFEEYDLPGTSFENGIAIGDGGKAAWFKDTEGNILALIQD